MQENMAETPNEQRRRRESLCLRVTPRAKTDELEREVKGKTEYETVIGYQDRPPTVRYGGLPSWWEAAVVRGQVNNLVDPRLLMFERLCGASEFVVVLDILYWGIRARCCQRAKPHLG